MSKENSESIQSKGGLARKDSLTPKERSEIARKAAAARWSIPKASHIGELKIGDTVISAAVLEDGTRLLGSTGIMKALGRPWRGQYEGTEMPPFLAANNLAPFIRSELRSVLVRVEYLSPSGKISSAYKAELLPRTCEAYLGARDAGILSKGQLGIARSCELVMRALAHVGIVALVDEATGFQKVRDRDALQKILEAYLRKELASWAKRFPDEFYEQLFRLRNWHWKGMSVNRPSYVGKLTLDIVYERLAPNIVEELQSRNPKDEKGRRKHKFHQWLTDDVGHPALAQHIHATIALMRASKDWGMFYGLLEKALPKKSGQLGLALDQPS